MYILPESGPFFFFGIVKNTCFLFSWVPRSVILPQRAPCFWQLATTNRRFSLPFMVQGQNAMLGKPGDAGIGGAHFGMDLIIFSSVSIYAVAAAMDKHGLAVELVWST